ncbi:hypothetical protein GCM10029978_117350 [Actinoallomurus acanthiterrae]
MPALLRRVADSIEELGLVEVHDLVLHQEITDDGPWFSATVYFHQTESEADRPGGLLVGFSGRDRICAYVGRQPPNRRRSVPTP